MISAQRVGFFSIRSGRVGYWTKSHRLDGQCPAGRVFQYQVGFGSGRSVEKYDRVFPGILFTFRVFWVFPGMSGIFRYFQVCQVFLGIFGFTHIYWGYFLTSNED